MKFQDLERCESYQALNEIGTPSKNMADSKKIGSFDSLASKSLFFLFRF